MATYYSKQSWVSDGTLELVTPSIKYLEKAHLEVQSDVAWAWDGDSIRFVSPIPDGDEVMLVRHTPFNNLMHIFSVVQGGGGSAAWTNLSVDENYTQLMYLLQEIAEGTFEYDPGMGPGDSYTKDEVDTMLAHCLRAAASDPVLREIPGIAERRNMLLGFDNDGQPVVYTQDDGAPDLENTPPADGYIQVPLDVSVVPTLLHQIDHTIFPDNPNEFAIGYEHFTRVGDNYVALLDQYAPGTMDRAADLRVYELDFSSYDSYFELLPDTLYSLDRSCALGDLFVVGYGGGPDPGPYTYGLRYFNVVTREWGFTPVPNVNNYSIPTIAHDGYLYTYAIIGSTDIQVYRGSVVAGELVLEEFGPVYTGVALGYTGREVYLADPSGAGTLGIQPRGTNTTILLMDIATRTWSTVAADIPTPAGHSRYSATYTRYQDGVGSPTVLALTSEAGPADTLLSFETESTHGPADGATAFTSIPLSRPWGPVNVIAGAGTAPTGLHILTPQGMYEVNIGAWGAGIAHVSVSDGVAYGVSLRYTLTELPAPYPVAYVSVFFWKLDIDLDAPGVAWLRVGGGTELPDGPGPYWVENKGWVVPGSSASVGEVLRRTAGGVAFSALGSAADRNVPTSGNAEPAQVVLGSDTRLTNARAPTAHTHVMADITDADIISKTDSGVGLYAPGEVDDASTIARILVPRPMVFSSDTIVYAAAGTAPSGTATFEVYAGPTLIGTITFAASATAGTYSGAAGTLSAGDTLRIDCVTASGISDVSITIRGV